MNSFFKISSSATQILTLEQAYENEKVPDLSDYKKEDFLKILPEFNNIFDDSEKNKFNIMFDIHSEIGKSIFNDRLYGKQAIMCLTLWIAHNITLSIGRTKNNNNLVTLDTQNPSSTVANDNGSKSKHQYLAGFREKYSLTEYGQILFPIMQQVGKWSIRGIY